MLSRLLTLTLVLLPLLQNVEAGIFDKNSPVKMLDPKSFRKVMAQNRTTVVAFVAPWCGHCQKLSPEYETAAKKLAPLVPLYAVDCDAAPNKGLCAEHGVRGFPTVKLFKKGGRAPAADYQGERTQAAIFAWAKESVPQTVFKVRNGIEGISEWKAKNKDLPRAILLNKSNKLPLLWSVLSNQFSPTMSFATVRDRRGMISKALGFPHKEDHRKPKVVIYEPGKKDPLLYEGLLKYDNLKEFLGKFSKGEADLSGLLQAFKEEKDAIPERQMREEEAEAIMQGKGYNPHAAGGMPMGGPHGGGGDPHGHGAHGEGASPHSHMGSPGEGEEAQHHFSGNEQSDADFSDVPIDKDGIPVSVVEDEKEMGDDDEETAGEIGRDRTDDL